MKARILGIVVVAFVVTMVLVVIFNTSVGQLFGVYTAANTTENGKSSDNPLAINSPGNISKSNSLPSSENIYINEVVTSNDTSLTDKDYGTPDWIELYNPTDIDINIKNYALSDDENTPTKYMLPSMTITAHGYLLVYAAKRISDASTSLPVTDFKLAAEGLTLFLTSPNGDSLQRLSIPCLASDISYAYDGHTAYRLNSQPTPAKANAEMYANKDNITAMPVSAPLLITEVLPVNKHSVSDIQGEHCPWIEVTNTSQSPVQLADYALSDVNDKYNKWVFPQMSLHPGECKLVFCSGKGAVASLNGELHTNFKLDSSDKGLYLTDMVNMQQQAVAIPDNMKENVSYGLQDGKWLFFSQVTPGTPNVSKGYDSLSSMQALDLSGIWINEVSAVQPRGSKDMDWIEIANGGSTVVSLKGYYLSDDMDNIKKYEIGNVSVAARGYIVINASASPSEQKDGVAPFGLSESGNTLVLSSPQGNIIDIFDTGVLRTGYTSGRTNGDASGDRMLFNTATPGATNGMPAGKAFTSQPVFSVLGGFQSGPIQLSMSCQTAGAKIYYTLNGSVPTQSDHLYSVPFAISENMPVRAIAYAPGSPPSDIQTATYLFGQKNTVPVVCLTMTPAEFNTMYANDNRYKTIERPGFIEYYDTDGKLGVEFPSAVRVQGKATRRFAQKALALKLDNGFGKSSITYPFFDGYPISTFKSVSLRAGGQDVKKAYIRDAFCSRLGSQIGLDAAENRWVVLYVNGAYRGLYDLREDIGTNMLAAKHNVDPSTVSFIERGTSIEGSNAEYRRVCTFARTQNLADDAIYQQFCQWVDVDAWADYMAMQLHFYNWDMVNMKVWFTRDYKVKIRPVYFDMDYALFKPEYVRAGFLHSYFSFGGYHVTDTIRVSMDISAGLWKNASFRELFTERYAKLLNTVLKPDNIQRIFDQMVAEMKPEMQKDTERWPFPRSYESWDKEIQDLRQRIIDRFKYAKQNLQIFCHLSDERMKELFPE